MKQNAAMIFGGKEMVLKSLTAGLIPAAGCSLFGVVVLVRGFMQPGGTVMEILLLPITAYVAGIGFMSVLFLKEWNRLRTLDRHDQEQVESREIEQKYGSIRAVYLTYQEEEANVYLMLGWVLLKVPVRHTDGDGQQPAYLLGWTGLEIAPRPKFDSKTRKFTI
jgi:hypothetical protein